jgi:hypothetical protein
MLRCLVFFLLVGYLAGFAVAQQPQVSDTKSSVDPDSSGLPAPPQGSSKEDWAKLQVDRKILPLLVGGATMAKSESASYSTELVRLQWRHSDPIDIWVIKPHGVEKPRVALYLYSYPSDIDRFRDDSWCKAATSNGLAAVGFISALTGERFRGRPMREWFIRELQESMGSSVHDVQLIIDYLARRGDLNVDKVGMFGQGSGGAIAMLAAAADPRITAVDVLNPWGDWPDWLKSSPVVRDEERSEFLDPQFLKKAEAVEPVTYLPSLKNRALRVQQIMDYPNTPPAARDKIAKAVPASELARFKDRTEHAEAWKRDGLSEWLAKQLESESSTVKSGQIAAAPK